MAAVSGFLLDEMYILTYKVLVKKYLHQINSTFDNKGICIISVHLKSGLVREGVFDVNGLIRGGTLITIKLRTTGPRKVISPNIPFIHWRRDDLS
jgi:hypothetical protein